jgi:hypothetical protein
MNLAAESRCVLIHNAARGQLKIGFNVAARARGGVRQLHHWEIDEIGRGRKDGCQGRKEEAVPHIGGRRFGQPAHLATRSSFAQPLMTEGDDDPGFGLDQVEAPDADRVVDHELRVHPPAVRVGDDYPLGP